MAFINVAEWSPDNVNDWLKGLDDCILPYVHFFINNHINGCRLLLLSSDDLEKLNVTKIGHQEIILDGVDLLKHLHYNFASETLQSLALRLGCKSRSLYNQLNADDVAAAKAASAGPASSATISLDGNGVYHHHHHHHHHHSNPVQIGHSSSSSSNRVTTKTLSGVCDILNSVKSFISWIDTYPFDGQDPYIPIRKTILTISIELASTSQRDQFVEMPNEVIKKSCLSFAELCDDIVQGINDSLAIQPAYLDIVTIRKKPEEEVGMQIHSSYSGIHIVGGVKFQSPVHRCGRIEEGDEIIQVNYQTVVGWQLKKLVSQMKLYPTEMILTVKKRPRHSNILGQVWVLKPYKIPARKSTTSNSNSSSSINSNNGSNLTNSNKNQGSRLRNAATTTTNTSDEENFEKQSKETEMKRPVYPFVNRKPKIRVRRRATISGASPTTTYAPIRIEDLVAQTNKESVIRSVSHDPSKHHHIISSNNHNNINKLSISQQQQPEVPPNLTVSSSSGGHYSSVSTATTTTTTPAITTVRTNTLQASTVPYAKVHPLLLTVEKKTTVGGGQFNKGQGETIPKQIQDYYNEPNNCSPSKRSHPPLCPQSTPKYQPLSSSFNLDTVIYEKTKAAAAATAMGNNPSSGGGNQCIGVVAPSQHQRRDSSSSDLSCSKDVHHQQHPRKDSLSKPAVPSREGLNNKLRLFKVSRRIACKDLGGGDCFGWLCQRKEENGCLVPNANWLRRWVVLTKVYLYCFKNEEEKKADCLLYLPSFKLIPNLECRSKKYAFKLFNSNTGFHFACETRSEANAWVSRLAELCSTVTSPPVDKTSREDLCYSETDEDDSDSGAGIGDNRSSDGRSRRNSSDVINRSRNSSSGGGGSGGNSSAGTPTRNRNTSGGVSPSVSASSSSSSTPTTDVTSKQSRSAVSGRGRRLSSSSSTSSIASSSKLDRESKPKPILSMSTSFVAKNGSSPSHGSAAVYNEISYSRSTDCVNHPTTPLSPKSIMVNKPKVESENAYGYAQLSFPPQSPRRTVPKVSASPLVASESPKYFASPNPLRDASKQSDGGGATSVTNTSYGSSNNYHLKETELSMSQSWCSPVQSLKSPQSEIYSGGKPRQPPKPLPRTSKLRDTSTSSLPSVETSPAKGQSKMCLSMSALESSSRNGVAVREPVVIGGIQKTSVANPLYEQVPRKGCWSRQQSEEDSETERQANRSLAISVLDMEYNRLYGDSTSPNNEKPPSYDSLHLPYVDDSDGKGNSSGKGGGADSDSASHSESSVNSLPVVNRSVSTSKLERTQSPASDNSLSSSSGISSYYSAYLDGPEQQQQQHLQGAQKKTNSVTTSRNNTSLSSVNTSYNSSKSNQSTVEEETTTPPPHSPPLNLSSKNNSIIQGGSAAPSEPPPTPRSYSSDSGPISDEKPGKPAVKSSSFRLFSSPKLLKKFSTPKYQKERHLEKRDTVSTTNNSGTNSSIKGSDEGKVSKPGKLFLNSPRLTRAIFGVPKKDPPPPIKPKSVSLGVQADPYSSDSSASSQQLPNLSTGTDGTPQSRARRPPAFKISNEYRFEYPDLPQTPDTPRKPTMGVSMIGKHRISNVSTDRAAIDAALVTASQDETSRHHRSGGDGPTGSNADQLKDEWMSIAKLIDQLGLTLTGETKMDVYKRTMMLSKPIDDEKMCQLVLSLRALQRNLKQDRQNEADAIDELLESSITVDKLRRWIQKYPHLSFVDC